MQALIFTLSVSLGICVIGGSPLLNSVTCPVCEPQYCPKSPDECPLGTAVDDCSCCPLGVICLLNMGDRCLDTSYAPAISQTDLGKYGSCGQQMTCQQRTDINPMRGTQESICTCLNTGAVCGSDNQTYDNPCLLRAAGGPTLAHRGPCSRPPHIAVGPSDGMSDQGESIALDCEVHGVPVPVITWQFISRNGDIRNLPGDDTSIVVQSRGGPESSMLTSWVQIMYVGYENAGTYVCVALNRLGEARAAAKVQVSHQVM